MYRSIRLASVILVAVLAALSLNAATFVVPDDETLIRRADAIVSGTVLDRWSQYTEDGSGIETIYRVLVTETLKGSPSTSVIELREWGGVVGDRAMMMSGAPIYEVGENYLIFTTPFRDGRPTTQDLVLGQFRYVQHENQTLLVRNTDDVIGWDSEGNPHHERLRVAAEFLRTIRDTVKRPSMALNAEASISPMANNLDTQTASEIGASAWTTGSVVNYTISGTPATGNTKNLNDGEDRIIIDDPHDDIPGTFNGSGVVATAFYTAMSGVGRWNIVAADIVVQNGVSSANMSQGNYNSTLVHEIGHTLGFRHSNKTADNLANCNTADCTPAAIMNSSIVNGLNGALQGWDQRGLAANFANVASFDVEYLVFNGGLSWHRDNPTVAWRLENPVSTCAGPTINTHPQSVTINEGSPTTLTVAATASEGTLSHQWFRGLSGTTTTPVGTNSTSLTISPTTTTSYWVRVTDGCGTTPSVNSNTATVTVTPAPSGPTVTSVTPNFGPAAGGTAVTITGTGFENGATVTFGGSAASGVVFVSSTSMTAVTPARAAGSVSVVVSNPGGASGTRTSGFTYQSLGGVVGDANNNSSVDVGDVFYLINHLFAGGPPPIGNGNANGIGGIDVGDIFFLINHLFAGGPAPSATTSGVSISSVGGNASIEIGDAVARRGQRAVRLPIEVHGDQVSGIALRVTSSSDAVGSIRFISPGGGVFDHVITGVDSASWISFRRDGDKGIVGEVELQLDRPLRRGETIVVAIDPAVSALSDAHGRNVASVANGSLTITSGTVTTLPHDRPALVPERH